MRDVILDQELASGQLVREMQTWAENGQREAQARSGAVAPISGTSCSPEHLPELDNGRTKMERAHVQIGPNARIWALSKSRRLSGGPAGGSVAGQSQGRVMVSR